MVTPRQAYMHIYHKYHSYSSPLEIANPYLLLFIFYFYFYFIFDIYRKKGPNNPSATRRRWRRYFKSLKNITTPSKFQTFEIASPPSPRRRYLLPHFSVLFYFILFYFILFINIFYLI
jgi:hypothetical protein